MRNIFLTAATAALFLGFAACTNDNTHQTTTTTDTAMNTVSPEMAAPADNTGQGIENGGMNATPGTSSGATSSSATGTNTGNAQGGSPGNSVMGTGTNTANTAGSNTSASNQGNNTQRYQAGPDVKSPSAPNSTRGGNDVIERANEQNDRSDRVKTPHDVNPRTGLAPVR